MPSPALSVGNVSLDALGLVADVPLHAAVKRRTPAIIRKERTEMLLLFW